MDLPLTQPAQLLFKQLMQIPPDFVSAENLLTQETFSCEEITKVAIRYTDECFLDIADTFCLDPYDHPSPPVFIPSSEVVSDRHSTHLFDVVNLLLDHGLDPNAIIGEDNIMEMLLYVDNAYVAADTMALLLEHGGNPNLNMDGQSVFGIVDFEIWFGSVEQSLRWRYDAWVHIWMVLLAYGCDSSGIQVFREYNSDALFDLKKLRKHRNYYYGLSYENGNCVIHIYDKNTFWEVARG